jgi:hypothetical protein
MSPLIAFGISLLAAGCGTGVDRSDYIRKNVDVFKSLPQLANAPMTRQESSPYRTEETGPVEGYVTLSFLRAPSQMSLSQVIAFYRTRLAPEWKLINRLSGPVLNFRRGAAALSINLESFRGQITELAIDHNEGDKSDG